MRNYLTIAKEALAKRHPSFFGTALNSVPPISAISSDNRELPPINIPSELITTSEHLTGWVTKQLGGKDVITINLETSGLMFAKDYICGIALHCTDESVYVSIKNENQHHIRLDEAQRILTPLFISDRPKIFHNATFGLPFLLIHGFSISGPFYDTRLISREYHKREQRSYALNDLSCHHVHPRADYWDKNLETLLKKKFKTASKFNIWRLDAEDIYRYACADAYLTRKLFDTFVNSINSNGMNKSYMQLEKKMTLVVCSMITSGLRIDEQKLIVALSQRKQALASLDSELDSLLNIQGLSYSSPKQLLSSVQALGFRPLHPDTGVASVCIDALINLKSDHPVICALIRRRKIENQLRQLGGLPTHIVNGRVHPHIMISAQIGERFSCTSPSLFTGKSHSDSDEKTLRHFVVPDDDCILTFFDLSASHFRILAHLCGDERMIEIFKSGKDFHRAVAELMFSLEYETITPEQRSLAKPIGFSVIYGMGIPALAESLRVGPEEARRLRGLFLNKFFPKLGSYLAATYRATAEKGYVLSGINGIKMSVPKGQAFKGINYQIQATESEILKNSLANIQLLLSQCRSRILLPLHDEIIVEIHRSEMKLIPTIKKLIESQNLRTPFTCEVAVAEKCWAEKKLYLQREAIEK